MAQQVNHQHRALVSLLSLSPTPMSTEDLAHALAADEDATSDLLRELRSVGAVTLVLERGDGSEFWGAGNWRPETVVRHV